MSRIGNKPVTIAKDVKAEVRDNQIFIEGAKGKLSRALHDQISVEIKDGRIFVKRQSETKFNKSLHGLYRVLILNMVTGASEGYVKELEIIGVGFRAAVQGDILNLQLGFSHHVNFPIPEGIKMETPKQTQIIIRGIDKEKVGNIASQIRSIRPPEPYKGKGIRYAGEYVKKKIGKAQAAAK